VSELFPISSLGHSVILPSLLGWQIDQNADYFLTFVVATHFATASALFVVYRDAWARFRGFDNFAALERMHHGDLRATIHSIIELAKNNPEDPFFAIWEVTHGTHPTTTVCLRPPLLDEQRSNVFALRELSPTSVRRHFPS
jgi:undecaprenyl pyrophosphate phosphatase UppP